MPLNLLIDRNCSFEKQAHQALLSPETDLVIVPPSTIKAPGVDALPFILLPLAGPEEFDLEVPFLYCVLCPVETYHRVARSSSSLTQDQELLPPALQFLPPTKQREADPTLRLMHVETLLLLCTTRWGRDFLRNHGVYEIVRALHEQETVDNVRNHPGCATFGVATRVLTRTIPLPLSDFRTRRKTRQLTKTR